MLKKKEIKIPENLKINFSIIKNKRFLVFGNLKNNIHISLLIPSFLNIEKSKTSIKVNYNFSFDNQRGFDGFFTYLSNFINNFQMPSKKTLILRGLGLKTTLFDSSIVLKLGFSHESIIDLDTKSKSLYRFFFSKKTFTATSYDKISLGNFMEKIYRLKKANCYKSRGLYFKNKKIQLKAIKKL